MQCGYCLEVPARHHVAPARGLIRVIPGKIVGGKVICWATDTPSMTDGARDEDIDTRLANLERQLTELRDEITESASPPRGPFGLPRPPTPGEFLQVTGEYAIPAAVSALEAQIKALELLKEVIRLLEDGRAVKEQGEATRDRAAATSRETLARLEDALAELQRLIEGNDLPTNPEARSILQDVRELTTELDTQKQDVTWQTADSDSVEIDVESELEDIKDEVDERRTNGDGEDDEN